MLSLSSGVPFPLFVHHQTPVHPSAFLWRDIHSKVIPDLSRWNNHSLLYNLCGAIIAGVTSEDNDVFTHLSHSLT